MSDSPNRPAPENPIDPATAALIVRKSWQLIRQAGLPRTDREDVEQLLTLQMLPRMPVAEPDGDRRPAFVRRALRQATINVLNHLTARKRSVRPVPISEVLGAGGDESLGPAGRGGLPGDEDRADLGLDLAGALAELPADLRAIAEQLRTYLRAEAARNLGIPRSTLAARVQEIRAVFERHALDDYL